MRGQWTLGRIYGIEIGVHFSWFFIVFLVTASLEAQLGAWAPLWPASILRLTALSTSLFFFGSLLVHELSHAVVAKGRGIPVKRITLFMLGGVAQADAESPSPATEFAVGVVGPLTSASIGSLCLGAAALLGPSGPPPASPLQAMLAWLGFMNLALAVFNLVPGYPLDGGRLLRALVWRGTADRDRATRAAAAAGQAIALLLVFWGGIELFVRGDAGGLWLFIVGFFLFSAAGQSALEVKARRALGGVAVREVMNRDLPLVETGENLKAFLTGRMLRAGHRCYLGTAGGRIAGIITLVEIAKIPARRWAWSTVEDALRPLDGLRSLSPSSTAWEALELMAREKLEEAPVFEGGSLAGTVSREDLLRVLRTMGLLRR